MAFHTSIRAMLTPTPVGSFLVASLLGATLLGGAACTKSAHKDAASPKDALTSPINVDGFTTPESVLYDEASDLYYVSNIDGSPLGADDNGFISKVGPDGKVLELKWIDGSKADVKLDAPKGMALSGGILWISDITAVRKFDLQGKPAGEVAIAGATFLNDVTPDGMGGIFITDMGVDGSFAPTGADAIYHVAKDGTVSTLIKDKALGAPNGIAAGDAGSVWVVTFGTGEIYQVDAAGKQGVGSKLPAGKLDGVVALPDGEFLVSSWESSSVYRGKPGGDWKTVAEGVESPADIGWDSRRGRLLIPLFMKNAIQIHAGS